MAANLLASSLARSRQPMMRRTRRRPMCLPRHHCPAYLSHRRLRRSRCPAGWSKKRATTPTSRRVNTVNGCPTFSLACSHQPPMRTQRPALRPIPSPDRSRCRPAYLSTRPCRSQPAAGLGRLYQRRRKIAATVPHIAAESESNPAPAPCVAPSLLDGK